LIRPEFATHILPRLSAAIPSGLLMPPAVIGDLDVGDPLGFSIATLLSPEPVTNNCPRPLKARSNGFVTPSPPMLVNAFGSPRE
jgi:hypothetical protein